LLRGPLQRSLRATCGRGLWFEHHCSRAMSERAKCIDFHIATQLFPVSKSPSACMQKWLRKEAELYQELVLYKKTLTLFTLLSNSQWNNAWGIGRLWLTIINSLANWILALFYTARNSKFCFAHLAYGIENSEGAESHLLRRFESQALRVKLESHLSKICSNKSRVESWLHLVDLESSYKNCQVTSSHLFASSG